eukprot:1473388-Alexandrium_andersonii.AAC.1
MPLPLGQPPPHPQAQARASASSPAGHTAAARPEARALAPCRRDGARAGPPPCRRPPSHELACAGL